MQAAAAIAALSGLAQSHRLAAFRFLVARGPAGAAAGEIANALGIPPSSLSFHLAHLSRAALIHQQRKGRLLVYSADFAAMHGLIAFLTDDCCGGVDCATADRAPREAA